MLPKYLFNGIVSLVFLLPGLIWYRQTGDLSIYLSNDIPDGQFLYVLSKLIGMYAFLCINWLLIVSLLEKTNLNQYFWLSLPHKILGVVAVALTITHFLLFLFAVYLRQGYFAWDLFLPDFHDYFHTNLSLGLFGLWLLLVVLFSGVFRAIFSKTAFRFLHSIYWIVIVLAYLHSFSIGTEVQSKWGVIFFGSLGVVTLALLMNLLISQQNSRRVILK